MLSCSITNTHRALDIWMGLTARSRDGAYRVRMRCRCLSGTQRQLAGRTRSKCCVGDGAGLHFVGAFLLHYQYPSSSGHLDGFNGSKQRRPDVSECGAVAFSRHTEAAGWENTVLMRRWGWGGGFICRCFPAPLPIPIDPWTSGWV